MNKRTGGSRPAASQSLTSQGQDQDPGGILLVGPGPDGTVAESVQGWFRGDPARAACSAKARRSPGPGRGP